MSLWVLLFGVLLLVSSNSCDEHTGPISSEYPFVEQKLSVNGKLMSNGINNFGFDMYKILARKDGNLIYSPFSISVALGLLYFMTKGQCSSEITTALHVYPNSETIGDGYQTILQPTYNQSVELGNKVFVEKRFELKETYVENIKRYFNAEPENVMFNNDPEEARKHINSWVSEKTHGKIPELFKRGIITTDTKAALVNTLYFKGLWHFQFDPKSTRQQIFHLGDGTNTTVPMMKLVAKAGYADIPSLGLKVLVLPYKGGNHNLIIILPKEIKGLQKLENEITYDMFLNEILSSVTYHQDVKLFIPKFNLDDTLSLKDTWMELGIKSVFSAANADFSNGVKLPKGLEVSSVQHRACIELDEQGTVASAATGVLIIMRSSVVTPRETIFRADHPFLFALTDAQTNAVLFMGRYANPK